MKTASKKIAKNTQHMKTASKKIAKNTQHMKTASKKIAKKVTSKKAIAKNTVTAAPVAKTLPTSKVKLPDPGFENAVSIDQWPVGRELVRVSLVNIKDIAYLDIRKFYLGEDGEPLPGKGICIKAEHKARVIAALNRI